MFFHFSSVHFFFRAHGTIFFYCTQSALQIQATFSSKKDYHFIGSSHDHVSISHSFLFFFVFWFFFVFFFFLYEVKMSVKGLMSSILGKISNRIWCKCSTIITHNCVLKEIAQKRFYESNLATNIVEFGVKI